jgi:hypothetical protein
MDNLTERVARALLAANVNAPGLSDPHALAQAAIAIVLAAAARAARDRMCEQEWPPQDGGQRTAEVMEAIRNLGKEGPTI